MANILASLALLLLLPGCMSTTQVFYKPGVSYDQIKVEQQHCRRMLGMFNPLVYLHAPPLTNPSEWVERENLHLSPTNMAACMQAKGFEEVTAEEDYARARAVIIQRGYAPLTAQP